MGIKGNIAVHRKMSEISCSICRPITFQVAVQLVIAHIVVLVLEFARKAHCD